MNPETDRISAIPLFVQQSPEELETVASWLEIREESEGRPLTPEGASGYEFFVIEEGTADVVHGGEVIGSLGPGDFFGEIALLDGGPRTATVTALSPMRCLVLSRGQFHNVIRQNALIAVSVLQTLGERLRALLAGQPT